MGDEVACSRHHIDFYFCFSDFNKGYLWYIISTRYSGTIDVFGSSNIQVHSQRVCMMYILSTSLSGMYYTIDCHFSLLCDLGSYWVRHGWSLVKMPRRHMFYSWANDSTRYACLTYSYVKSHKDLNYAST